jgi:transcriptional regulator with XRE-family HTH domain
MQISKKTKKELKASKKSTWSKEADFRITNRKWLRYSSHIARRILSAIEDTAGLNQSELARQVGVSSQYVSKIIQGKENLTLETIAKLSEALKVELISFPPYKHTNIQQHASAYLWQISSCAQIHNANIVVLGELFNQRVDHTTSETIKTMLLYSASTTTNSPAVSTNVG